MKVTVAISPEGVVTFLAASGTFTEATLASNNLLTALTDAEIEIEDAGEPEQHRHDDPVTINHHVNA